MESAGSIRKRKLPHHRQDEDEEEAKIQKFSALIQNIRESRDRWMKMNKNANNIENRGGVWIPTFELQDFAQDQVLTQNPAVTFPVPFPKGATQEDHKMEGLDLKLSL
ncbi:hypothetical protein QN277_021735 [Acacia crassicarpa]|uniref:Uncharacterized protein n=1 Tax=Acacia crassicarpa TaxID=499986 RepID=A0AAE1MTD5_9FABA|nr:hypothetical protein QN277_021735 [Acacia crassicarpa]